MNQSVGTQSIPPTDFMSVLHPRLFLDDPDAINVNDSDVERLKGFIFNDNDKESGNIDSEREELGLETLLDNVQQSLETSSIETDLFAVPPSEFIETFTRKHIVLQTIFYDADCKVSTYFQALWLLAHAPRLQNYRNHLIAPYRSRTGPCR